jgi:hypothetical protein
MTGAVGAKQRRRRMDTPYSRITEIKEAPTPEAANDLLKEGFILVKVMENYTNTPERQFSNIVYVLGRQKSNGGSHTTSANKAPSGNQSAPPAVDPAILDKRPWKEYTNGGGEWTFYMNREGILLPELKGASEFIDRLKAGQEIVVGDHGYRIKDKFLKRFPAGQTQG